VSARLWSWWTFRCINFQTSAQRCGAAAKTPPRRGRLAPRILAVCVKSTRACSCARRARLPLTSSRFAAQSFSNLSPMSVTCPAPSGPSTSSQPSVMQSISALKFPVTDFFYHASAYWLAILVWDFCLSVCHVVMLCLNESTKHQTHQSLFHKWKEHHSVFLIPSSFQNSEVKLWFCRPISPLISETVYDIYSRADNGSRLTHDPRDPSVNWPVTRVTHDPWLTSTHQSLSQCDVCVP